MQGFKWLFVFLIAFIAVFFVFMERAEDSLSLAMQRRGLPYEVFNLFSSKVVEKNLKGDGLLVFTGSLGKEEIRIKIVKVGSMGAAVEYFNKKKALIRGLFGERHSPYRGQLTEELWCAPKYRPRVEGRGLGRFVAMYANQRLGIGVCSPENIKLQAHFLFLYDSKGKEFIQIEYFSELDNNRSIAGLILQGLDKRVKNLVSENEF